MAIRTRRATILQTLLPLDPSQELSVGELRDWLNTLLSLLEESFESVHSDFAMGASTLRVFTKKPTQNDVEEGQLVLWKDGTTLWLCTKVDNAIRRIQFDI